MFNKEDDFVISKKYVNRIGFFSEIAAKEYNFCSLYAEDDSFLGPNVVAVNRIHVCTPPYLRNDEIKVSDNIMSHIKHVEIKDKVSN
jgi:hypothetical protein